LTEGLACAKARLESVIVKPREVKVPSRETAGTEEIRKLNNPDVEVQETELRFENEDGEVDLSTIPDVVVLPVRLEMTKLGEHTEEIGILN